MSGRISTPFPKTPHSPTRRTEASTVNPQFKRESVSANVKRHDLKIRLYLRGSIELFTEKTKDNKSLKESYKLMLHAISGLQLLNIGYFTFSVWRSSL